MFHSQLRHKCSVVCNHQMDHQVALFKGLVARNSAANFKTSSPSGPIGISASQCFSRRLPKQTPWSLGLWVPCSGIPVGALAPKSTGCSRGFNDSKGLYIPKPLDRWNGGLGLDSPRLPRLRSSRQFPRHRQTRQSPCGFPGRVKA